MPGLYPRVRRGTVVRPMSPVGTYWEATVLAEEASIVVRDDLIFTACHFDKDALEGEYYTEHDDLTPEEIRLLGSLLLLVGPERGFMAQYPDSLSIRLEDQPCLDDPAVLERLEAELRASIRSPEYRPPTCPPLPPSSYGHFHWPIESAIQKSLFEAIDISDALLVRGISTLLKAGMLHCHLAFQEEANYALWISLDASHSIILEHLEATGISNPSSVDAQNFIHDAFGEKRSGLKYFQEFYEDRIITMHPKNRFGIFGVAPLGHDDFYWLHNGLRDVYRYILLGEVVDPQAAFDTPEFWENMRAGSPRGKATS